MINFLGYTMNGWFLAAGAICAAVPLIIHLLNRRRYRVVEWAAMDFLRQALQRNRRIMQIRDLLLLALRTLAVLLFGLALAQPFWKERTQEKFNPSDRQPLHAVMIVDNSMSMAYEAAAGENLLSRAKDRARQFIEELPAGSRISVVPLCGTSGTYSLDPYRSAADATNAVDQIEVVDATTNIDAVERLAKDAANLETNLAQRIVFLSDQQRANWDKRLNPERLKQMPDMQVVDVAGVVEPENVWVSEFQMDDDIADLATPINFTVRVRYAGLTQRKDVQVSLWVDDEQGETKRVSLDAGKGAAEVSFQHTFRSDLQSGEMRFVPVKVALSADDQDRLTNDNERFLVVPVVAALPVVFIDDVAPEDENRSLNKYGESWPLRRWLAPITDRNSSTSQLVRIEHVTIDDVSQELLADARLVVIAGVEDPGENVELLREYVQQGGQLLIAAGGAFDPVAWNAAAWKDAQGILPVPLEPDFIGQVPGEDGASFEWFELVYEPNDALFKLVGETDADLTALYTEPFYFQAIRTGDVEAVRESLRESEAERLREELATLSEVDKRVGQFNDMQGRQTISPEQQAQQLADKEAAARLRPKWLNWSTGERVENDDEEDEQSQDDFASLAGDDETIAKRAKATAERELPDVLAHFDNGAPYLIKRQIGKGQVVLATSGIQPKWNTIARSKAILLFDRLLRGMLRQTVEPRTFTTRETIALPLEGNTANLDFELQRPAAAGKLPPPEPLSVGFISARSRGLTIHNALHQGIYTITAYESPRSGGSSASRDVKWRTALAVNIDNSTDVSESDLEPLTKSEIDERLAGVELPITWVGATGSISLDGVTIRGQNIWMWLAFVVLLLLLVEISVLAWPSVKASAQAGASSTPLGAEASGARTT